MKTRFVRAALYAYANIDKDIKALDSCMMKRALCSHRDLRPVEEIWDDMLNKFVLKKIELQKFKQVMHKVADACSPPERRCLDRKYLKTEYVSDHGNYYSYESSLLERTERILEKNGYDDDWFKTIGQNLLGVYIKKAGSKKGKEILDVEARKSIRINRTFVKSW